MSIKHSHKVHKYERINGTWTCSLRGCRHFLPGNVPKGPLGRPSICHRCSDEFEIDNVSMMKDQPICQDCDMNNPVRQLGNEFNSVG